MSDVLGIQFAARDIAESAVAAYWVGRGPSAGHHREQIIRQFDKLAPLVEALRTEDKSGVA